MFLPLLFFTRVDVLDSALLGREAAVGADVLLVGFLRVLAVTDVLHHLAQTDELIADDLVVLVQSGLEDVALGQLQIADALGLGGENGTGHGTQALAQVVQTSADRQAVLGEGGLAVGASLEDLGKGLRSQVGTMFGTREKGPRYLEMAEGYCSKLALNDKDEIIGYEFISLGKMMDAVKKGVDANEALKNATGHYGQWDNAAKYIDPRQE